MSKFMREINKILNKEADGVKTISEQYGDGRLQTRTASTPAGIQPRSSTPRPGITPREEKPPTSGYENTSPDVIKKLYPNPSDRANEPQSRTPDLTPQARADGNFNPQTATPRAGVGGQDGIRAIPSSPRADVSPEAGTTPRPAATQTQPAPAASSAAAPAPRATPAPSPNLDPHAKSKAMFQDAQDRASRGENDGPAFFDADRQRTAELKGLRNETFERFVRSFVKEQNDAKEQWKGEIKKKPYMGANPEHASTSPNAQHMEEDEQLDEIFGTATPLGGKHNPERTVSKNLGGKRLQKRVSLQRTGNQRRKPGIYEEAKEKFMKKLSEKRTETPLGKTATNSKYSETVNTSPESPDLTGSA